MPGVEFVDILQPPRFEPSGEIKEIWDAVRDGNWLGAINLWIVRPGPALLYQERPPGGWAPGKLDGSVAGYYRAGETGLDGLREAEEELGRSYFDAEVTSIGHRLNVGVDSIGRERRAVITIFMTFDESPLSSFRLHHEEVPAVYEIALSDVAMIFGDYETGVVANGLNHDGLPVQRTVRATDFSYMWDHYHEKIAVLAERYFNGERSLRY